MNSPITVDASVFVNAFSPTEAGSDQSAQFINKIRKAATPIIQPTLFLPEVIASIACKKGDKELALQLAQELRRFSSITIVSLDENLADFASEVAANYRLRGSDAVYVAVALRFGCELVTLDKEQLERLPGIVAVRSPAT